MGIRSRGGLLYVRVGLGGEEGLLRSRLGGRLLEYLLCLLCLLLREGDWDFCQIHTPNG